MSEQTQNVSSSYGYADDSVKVSPFNFGGNFGSTTLTKFEWIPNGGADGAEQEAIDIIFNINGTEKSYRMFPVVKAFLKDNKGETTDPSAPEFKEAVTDFNARMIHILHAFVADDTLRSALNVPINSFKEYARICMGLLPKNYKDVKLDIFVHYGWNLGDKERTYLEIPTKMKTGKWLVVAQPGTWEKHLVDNPGDDVREALFYTNEKSEKHPFVRNGWFMNSKYGHQQKADGSAEGDDSSGTQASTTEAAKQIAADGAKKAATW